MDDYGEALQEDDAGIAHDIHMLIFITVPLQCRLEILSVYFIITCH